MADCDQEGVYDTIDEIEMKNNTYENLGANLNSIDEMEMNDNAYENLNSEKDKTKKSGKENKIIQTG